MKNDGGRPDRWIGTRVGLAFSLTFTATSFPSRQTRQSRQRRGLEASPYSVGSFIGSNGKPIDAPWDTLASAQETVGRRVRLYWGGDKKWYNGKIVLVHPTSRQVFIKYDDHDERWHKMWEE